MARAPKTLCTQCDHKIAVGTAFCPNCEQPTLYATYDERVSWEVAQWKKMRAEPLAPAAKMQATPTRASRAAKADAKPSLTLVPDAKPEAPKRTRRIAGKKKNVPAAVAVVEAKPEPAEPV